MSTIQLCMLACAGLTSNTFTNDLTNTGSTSGTYSASITFNSDGTSTGVSSWHTPTSAGIGSQFWAKLTTSSLAMVSVSGSLAGGAWTQLSSAQGVTVSNSGIGSEGTGSYTVQFATDSAGANITGTVSGNIDVGYITAK